MTFNANIPQATDLISQSQSQIQTNFSQANTAMAVDHVAFDVLTNQGFHKKVTFQAVIADPGQVTPISSLYIKTVSGKSQLFFQNGALAANVIPITASVFQTYTPVPSGTGLSYVGLSAAGKYAVVGGMTFFTMDITFTSVTNGTTGTLQITLPSTTASAGQGIIDVTVTSGTSTNDLAIGTVSSGNNYILFPTLRLTGFANGRYLVNGFYI